MRVLVLGATGILGHKLMQKLGRDFEVYGTVRREFDFSQAIPGWAQGGVITNVGAENPASVEKAIRAIRPEAVVNCIASPPWVQTRAEHRANIAVNAQFPLDLAVLCENAGARLIHISSDGVFSGARGLYTECDSCDAADAYGKAKFLGEVSGPNCLTLRVSLIGRDIRQPKSGLLEWLLSQRGKTIVGYRRSVFSGLTSCALAGIIRCVLAGHTGLSGVFHVAGAAVSKLALLESIRDRFSLRIRIEPGDGVVCDRSLDSSAFQRETAIRAPSWPEMIDELYEDSLHYAHTEPDKEFRRSA
jgi:dTDP-4-dehydrorhamnose reductase